MVAFVRAWTSLREEGGGAIAILTREVISVPALLGWTVCRTAAFGPVPSLRSLEGAPERRVHDAEQPIGMSARTRALRLNRQEDVRRRLFHSRIPVSYTHLTLPTNREV